MYLTVEFIHSFNSMDFRIKGHAEFKDVKGPDKRYELVFEGHAYLVISESLLPEGVVHDNDYEPLLEIEKRSAFYQQVIIPEIWKRHFNLPFQELNPEMDVIPFIHNLGGNNERIN
jgi:hypothetical protein